MKKFLLILPFVSALMGCSLYFDEQDIPEEERGIGEPYTIKNDTVDLTYEYNDGVHPVTANVQKYIAKIDADTVIYFMDNLPKEWLPDEGEYLAAGCSRLLPEGLNNKVLDVQHDGGLYKVVTTKATIDEVYKELDYELKMDYEVPDLTELLDPDAEDDSTFTYTDWSLVDRANGVPEEQIAENYARAKHTDFSRASDDEGLNGKVDEQEKSFGFSFDSRVSFTGTNFKWAKSLEKQFLKAIEGSANVQPFLSINYSNSEKITLYEEVKKSQNYRKSYQDRLSTTDLNVTLGLSGVAGVDVLDKHKNLKGIVIPNSSCKPIINFAKKFKLKNNFKPIEGQIPIPVPLPVPVVFKITFGVNFSADISGCIGVNNRKVTKTRTGTITNGDDDPIPLTDDKGNTTIELPLTEEEKKQNSTDFFVMGNFDVSARGQLGIAATACGVATVTVAGNLQAGLEGQATHSITENSSSFDDDNSYIRAYVKAYGTASFDVGLGGFSLYGHEVKFLETYLLDSSQSYYPSFSMVSVPGKIDETGWMTYRYTLANKGYSSVDKYPRLAIFKNGCGENNLLGIIQPGNTSSDYWNTHPFATGYEYIFSCDVKDYDKNFTANNIYYAAPAYCIMDGGKEDMHIYPSLAVLLESPYAALTFIEGKQTMGESLYEEFDFDHMDEIVESYDLGAGEKGYNFDAMDCAKYGFMFKMNVHNRTQMDNLGVHITVTADRQTEFGTVGDVLIQTTASYTSKIKKSGTYTIEYTFVTNNKGQYPMTVTLEPYCKDNDGNTTRYPKKEIKLQYPVKATTVKKGDNVIKLEL